MFLDREVESSHGGVLDIIILFIARQAGGCDMKMAT